MKDIHATSEPTATWASHRDACLMAGIKPTHQRLVILGTIHTARDHPSVETVHARVREQIPTIGLDTVYRALSLFEERGLIQRVHAFDDHARFDGQAAPHHHFVCVRCQSVFDFAWEALDRLPVPPEAHVLGLVEGRSMVLRGICSKCLNHTKEEMIDVQDA